MNDQLMLGLTLSLMAGLATGIGAAVAFFMKGTDTRVLSFALGASAGVMLYISFMEFLPESFALLGEDASRWLRVLPFFGGMAVSCIIDRLVPDDENPHVIHKLDEWEKSPPHNLRRSAYLFAFAIAIHNFPEGIATVVSAFSSEQMAYSVAIAVAVHNIPEGVAVAIPLYCATQSRWKAFGWATLTGLAEPLGALVAMAFLMPYLNDQVMAIVFASVAGIMVYISLDELLPMAQRWGHHHISIYGLSSGMLLMACIL